MDICNVSAHAAFWIMYHPSLITESNGVYMKIAQNRIAQDWESYDRLTQLRIAAVVCWARHRRVAKILISPVLVGSLIATTVYTVWADTVLTLLVSGLAMVLHIIGAPLLRSHIRA